MFASWQPWCHHSADCLIYHAGRNLLHACAVSSSALDGSRIKAWAAALRAPLTIVIIIVQHFSLSGQKPSSIKLGKCSEYAL